MDDVSIYEIPDVSSVGEFFQETYTQLADSGDYTPDPDTSAIHLDDYGVDITPDGEVFATYDDLRDFLQDTELTGGTPSDNYAVEAHHLLTTDFMGHFGLDSGDVPAVGIDRFDEDNLQNSHQFYTDQIAKALETSQFFDVDEIYDAHAVIYEQNGHAEWADRALDYIADHRDELIGLYERGEIPGANEPDYDDRADRVIEWLNSIHR